MVQHSITLVAIYECFEVITRTQLTQLFTDMAKNSLLQAANNLNRDSEREIKFYNAWYSYHFYFKRYFCTFIRVSSIFSSRSSLFFPVFFFNFMFKLIKLKYTVLSIFKFNLHPDFLYVFFFCFEVD